MQFSNYPQHAMRASCSLNFVPGLLTANERCAKMTNNPNSTRLTLLFATGFATLLQTLVMILMATDKISNSVAVPMLGIVVIFGILPAMAFIKSKT